MVFKLYFLPYDSYYLDRHVLQSFWYINYVGSLSELVCFAKFFIWSCFAMHNMLNIISRICYNLQIKLFFIRVVFKIQMQKFLSNPRCYFIVSLQDSWPPPHQRSSGPPARPRLLLLLLLLHPAPPPGLLLHELLQLVEPLSLPQL